MYSISICVRFLYRYDPHISIPESINSETARVQFLVAIASAMASKARVKLNPRNLYAADGLAVKEMLKLARLIYR